jgi:general secretion pathway protein A
MPTHKPFATIYKQLGFKEFPFSLSADPRFFYLGALQLRILEDMQDMVDARQGLCAVDGDVGVGKSTLARRLYDLLTGEAGDVYRVVNIPTSVYKTSQDVLVDIGARLNVPPGRSQQKLLANYEATLVKLHTAGQTPVVILDDAHLMRPACLEAFQYLYNFDVRDKLIQVIMLGQNPELRALLERNRGLMSRIVRWQTILPLSYAESLEMVIFRCTVAGRTDPLLEESAFTRLFEYSGGVPRVMVMLCGSLLSPLAETNRRTANTADVDQAIRRYEQRYHAAPEEAR